MNSRLNVNLQKQQNVITYSLLTFVEWLNISEVKHAIFA